MQIIHLPTRWKQREQAREHSLLLARIAATLAVVALLVGLGRVLDSGRSAPVQLVGCAAVAPARLAEARTLFPGHDVICRGEAEIAAHRSASAMVFDLRADCGANCVGRPLPADSGARSLVDRLAEWFALGMGDSVTLL